MVRGLRGYGTVAASLVVIVLVGTALWWYTGSADFALGKLLLGLAIGAGVGFATMVVQLTRPAARALAIGVPWRGRRYLVPGELPPPPTLFVGQETLLALVTGKIRHRSARAGGGPLVILLRGEPGVGKSGLALKAAAEVAHEFRHGVVYAAMTEATKDSSRLHNVLGDLIDSLQGPGETVPRSREERVKEFRRLSRRKPRVLYVLDDVVDEQAVKTVLPASSQAVVLITSRQPLPLAEAVSYPVEPLSPEESVALLNRLLRIKSPATSGAPRDFAGLTRSVFGLASAGPPSGQKRIDGSTADGPTDEPTIDEETLRAVRRVAVTAAGYPLALHLAARAISIQGLWALPALVADLPDEADPLTEEVARQRMLDLSVKVLTDAQRHVLFHLAWMPNAPFVPWMVQALAGLATDDEAWQICERLADLRLLERNAPDATGVLRLRLPDRVADYLKLRVDREIDEGQLTEADREHALARLDEAPRRRTPTVADLLAMLSRGEVGHAVDEARQALADAVGDADPLGPSRVLAPGSPEREVLAVLAEVLSELGGLDDAMDIATSQDRARAELGVKGQPRDAAEARLKRTLGKLLRRAGQLDRSVLELETAHRVAERVQDVDQQILALRELAITQAALDRRGNGYRQAMKTLESANRLLDAADQRTYLECRLIEADVVVRLSAGDHRANDEELWQAVENLDRALTLLPPDEFRLWRAWLMFHRTRVLIRQAEVAGHGGEPVMADDGEIVSPADQKRRLLVGARFTAELALGEFAEMSNRYGTARCRLELGRIYAQENRAEAALQPLEEARETFFFVTDRWIEARTALVLAETRVDIGRNLVAVPGELDFARSIFKGVRDRRGLSDVRRVRARWRQQIHLDGTTPATTVVPRLARESG